MLMKFCSCCLFYIRALINIYLFLLLVSCFICLFNVRALINFLSIFREYTAEIMFESFNVPGLYIAVQVRTLFIRVHYINIKPWNRKTSGKCTNSDVYIFQFPDLYLHAIFFPGSGFAFLSGLLIDFLV